MNRVPVTQIAIAINVSVRTIGNWLREPSAVAVLEYYSSRLRKQTLVTREFLNEVLIETLYMADEPKDRISAVKELGHLNGLYPDKNTKIKVEIPGGAISDNGSIIEDVGALSESELLNALEEPASEKEEEKEKEKEGGVIEEEEEQEKYCQSY